MSFQLPAGMTQEKFESSLVIKYFDAGDQQWKTDGISNVRISWTNFTLMFEVSHLTRFAGFAGEAVSLPHDWSGDGIVSIVGDVPCFVESSATFRALWTASISRTARNESGPPMGGLGLWLP